VDSGTEAITGLASLGLAALVSVGDALRRRRRDAREARIEAEEKARLAEAEAEAAKAEKQDDDSALRGDMRGWYETLSGENIRIRAEMGQLSARVANLEAGKLLDKAEISRLRALVRQLVAQLRQLGATVAPEADREAMEE